MTSEARIRREKQKIRSFCADRCRSNFEAQLALEVPQRAFRPSFSDPSHSRDRRFDLAGSAFDFDRLSAADRCRSFASVRKMTSEARIPREKQKNSVVLHPNGQFRTLEKPPFWPSFSTGPCRSESVLCLACSQFWWPS